MGRNTWDRAKTLLLPLPFILLAAYFARAPLPVPAFLLPERSYLAVDRSVDPDLFRALRGRGEAFAVLSDALLPLPSAGVGWNAAAEKIRPRLPEHSVVEPVLSDLRSGIRPLERARLVIDRTPTRIELDALEAARSAGGEPLVIDSSAARGSKEASGLVLALSLAYSPTERRIAFDLLLAPAARAARLVEVSAQPEGSGAGALLYRSGGSELPPDLVLRLSTDRSAASAIEVAVTGQGGAVARTRLGLGVELHEAPRVLLVSDRPPGTKTFIEDLYPTLRVASAKAASLDLLSYELVVLDGIPIGKIGGSLEQGLLDVAGRRTGSLLFVADSPDFGKMGDNPSLEELLPVSLMPRSAKDLPDLAVLILIDDSGSMFGDKLSLAKMTGLELLHNLKPGDLVGMMLFSDTRSWVYDFQPNSKIVAAPTIEPITAGGGTDLAPALAEGLARLARQPLKDKHAVLITDGITKPADFQAIADEARAEGISISALGVGEDANRSLLERIALGTGGRYYPVLSADQIPGLLFEDRKSAARPNFAQGRIPVLALNGERVATIGGMAQYAPVPTASVIFTNELGDPLFATRELGNRAVLLFASDIHGTYTADFFSRSATAGAFKDRLDALFAEKPARIRVVETAAGLSIVARSDAFLEPRLLLSRAGSPTLDAAFRRTNPETWAAEVVPPFRGQWNASIADRGGSFASFPLVYNGNLAGTTSGDLAALTAYRPQAFRFVRLDALWLILFFASSLVCTIVLRVKR